MVDSFSSCRLHGEGNNPPPFYSGEKLTVCRNPYSGGQVQSGLMVSSAISADLTGKPRVIDGDTIAFGDQRVRLHGIDAPESKQTCSVYGKPWNCGQEATFALANLVGNHWIKCEERDKDRYGRIVAVCYAGTHDLNARMVSDGWVLAYAVARQS